MNTSAIHEFQPGKAYFVAHRERAPDGAPRVSRAILRIFKGMERRFGEIPCAVFTSRIDPSTTATYDAETKTLSLSGKRIPQSEMSVPHYDIVSAELAPQH